MADLSGFDANAVQPTSFDVIPAGDYEACIVASEMKPTQTGGQMLQLELQVLNGEYQNRKLWDNLNLVNANAKAVEIAKGTLSSICRAVGVMTPKDSSELHNKPMRIKVGIRKQDGFDDRNTIKSYKPRQAGPAAMPVITTVSSSELETDATPWG